MRAAGLVVVGLLAVTAPARAGEPADRGISMSGWAGAAVDRSVAAADSGRPLHDGAPLIGVTALGNIRSVALGGALDTTPASTATAGCRSPVLLGFQPEVEGTRLQFLGEAGRHRFSNVGGSMFAHQLGPDTWLPYLGVRLGVARTVPAHGLFEVGRLAVRALRRRRGDRHQRQRLSSARRPGPTTAWAAGWAGWRFRSGCAWEAADPRRTEEMMAAR